MKKMNESLADSKNRCTFATAIEKESNKINCALVQLVRIHACHAWGHGFESRTHRNKHWKSMFYKLNTRFYTQECKVGCFCNSCFRYYGIQTRKEQRMVISGQSENPVAFSFPVSRIMRIV